LVSAPNRRTDLRTFENEILRRIFGSKTEELTRKWRKIHERLHNLYSSSYILEVGM